MSACMLESMGWVIFCIDKDLNYRIVVMDAHDQGYVFGYIPLMVYDLYEHSYFGEWGANKAGYVKAILKATNWKEVNKRFLLAKSS